MAGDDVNVDSHQTQAPPTQVESNLTSMIDVVFLLIVFFLVSRWSAVKRSPWICQKCQTRRQPLRGGISVGGQRAVRCRTARHWSSRHGVGATFLHRCRRLRGVGREGHSDLKQQPDLGIHLRADREVHFEWIQPILDALRAPVPMSMVLKPK